MEAQGSGAMHPAALAHIVTKKPDRIAFFDEAQSLVFRQALPAEPGESGSSAGGCRRPVPAL